MSRKNEKKKLTRKAEKRINDDRKERQIKLKTPRK